MAGTTALYLRISQDDDNRDESDSIANQRDLLNAHVNADPVLSAGGVRYIAVTESIDSINGLDDLLPMRDLFNEWHVRETSKKVKTVFVSKAQRGERLGGKVPYGYISRDKKLFLDERRQFGGAFLHFIVGDAAHGVPLITGRMVHFGTTRAPPLQHLCIK